MTRFTITALLAMACGARIAATAQTTSPDPQPTIQLHVQPGDSLTNLFGNDWQEVYQLNRCECRFASYINDANDPNFIFAGSSLTLPPDVHLTERAFERIGFAKDQRDNLRSRLEALMQAEGDTAASAKGLNAKLDGAMSVNDLEELDKATAELETVEVQYANQAKAVIWIIGTASILVVLAAMFAVWWDQASSGSRRLKAALKMSDTIVG